MSKSTYVDGFVLTVPKKRLNEYKKMANLGKKFWTKYGALDYKECVMDDAKPEGVSFNFPKMAKAKKDEVVIFSYITFKSKAHRDQVNKKVMSDPGMGNPGDIKDMPMDMKRFAYGGFKVIVG